MKSSPPHTDNFPDTSIELVNITLNMNPIYFEEKSYIYGISYDCPKREISCI